MTTTTWWDHLVDNWYPQDKRPPREVKRKSLQVKRKLVNHVQPRSICEIGVRAGYSAYAILDVVPEARFLGIDLGTKYHGPPEPLRKHALFLTEQFPNVEMIYQDSHAISTIDPPVDLFHIDGDHTYEGCLQDLELALRSGAKWALLDDSDHPHLKGVARAINVFAERHRLLAAFYNDSHNGTAFIELGGEGGP